MDPLVFDTPYGMGAGEVAGRLGALVLAWDPPV